MLKATFGAYNNFIKSTTLNFVNGKSKSKRQRKLNPVSIFLCIIVPSILMKSFNRYSTILTKTQFLFKFFSHFISLKFNPNFFNLGFLIDCCIFFVFNFFDNSLSSVHQAIFFSDICINNYFATNAQIYLLL